MTIFSIRTPSFFFALFFFFSFDRLLCSFTYISSFFLTFLSFFTCFLLISFEPGRLFLISASLPFILLLVQASSLSQNSAENDMKRVKNLKRGKSRNSFLAPENGLCEKGINCADGKEILEKCLNNAFHYNYNTFCVSSFMWRYCWGACFTYSMEFITA